LFSIAIASGVSFGVGVISANLGLGTTISGLLTSLISTLLSLFPVAVKWLFGILRRGGTVFLLILVFSFEVIGNSTPAYAQADIPEQAINQLMYPWGMTAVKWYETPGFPGYSVTMYPGYIERTLEFTNSVAVYDVSSEYGSNGGAVWAQAYMQEYMKKYSNYNCASTQESFHDLSAYSILCRNGRDYIEGFIWGMDNWGLATFNYLEPPEASAAALAESLYEIMLGLLNSSVPKPTAVQPNSQTQGGGAWTQEKINQMVVTVLKGYAKEIKTSEPGVYSGGWKKAFTESAGDPNDVIIIMEPYADGFYDTPLENYLTNGQISAYDYFNHSSGSGSYAPGVQVVYSKDQKTIQAIEDYYLNRSWVKYGESPAPIKENTVVYKMPVSMFSYYWETDSSYLDNLYWNAGNWFFRIYWSTVEVHPSPTPDLRQAAEILYLLSAQAGMFNPPSNQPVAPAQSVPEQPDAAPVAPTEIIPPVISEDDISNFSEDELLGLLLVLSPAALLPALGVAGISTMLDLLRRRSELPPGMVKSPVNSDLVTLEVAAEQRRLLEQGYRYDPKTNRLIAPQYTSQIDGSLVSRSQYENERKRLLEGYVFDGFGFVTPKDLRERKRLSRQSEQDRVRMSEEDARRREERDVRKEHAAQLRSSLEQMESQAEREFRASQMLDQSTVQTLWAASKLTSRTVVTGVNPDGSFSFLTLGGRVLAAGMTAGTSELVMSSADFGYRTFDGVQSGQSLGEAAATSAAWMAAEVGAVKGAFAIGKGVLAVGKWALEPAASSAPVTWAGRQLRGVVNTLVDTVRSSTDDALDPAMKQAKQRLVNAVGSGKPSEILPEQVRTLYQNGGRTTLKQLQSGGHITPAQARALNQTISTDINNAITQASPDAIRSFEQKTGVKVTELIVGDSGSSSSRSLAPRSVGTDADRSILATFDEASLNKQAQKLMAVDTNLTPAQAREMAHQQLQEQLTSEHQSQVSKQLNHLGLTPEDLDQKNYSGLRGDPSKGDSYPAGFNRVRQATQGDAQVFRVKENGEIVNFKAHGQYMTDREALAQIEREKALGLEAANIIKGHQPIITKNDAMGVLSQQQSAVADTSDPLKLAKALTRADKARQILAGNTTGPTPPPISKDVLNDARRILANPQGSTGKIPPDFAQRAGSQLQDLFNSTLAKK
jgi:hypothetical protein